MSDTGNGHGEVQEPLARGEAPSCGKWALSGGETEAREGWALLCPLCVPTGGDLVPGLGFPGGTAAHGGALLREGPGRGKEGLEWLRVSPLGCQGVPSGPLLASPESDTALYSPSLAGWGNPRSRISLAKSSSASEGSSSAAGFGSGTNSTSKHPNPEGRLCCVPSLCALPVSPPCVPHPGASLPINVPASLPVSP